MNQARLAKPEPHQKTVIARLLQLYIYEFTTYLPFAIGSDGLYEYRYLERCWRQHPYMIYSGDEIAGFAFVIDSCPITGASPCFFMAEFFVMKAYRRHGVGSDMCNEIFAIHRGKWHVGVIEPNEQAMAFWKTIAAKRSATTSRHEHDDRRWLVYEFQT
jgi:predicted acetyltransferase